MGYLQKQTRVRAIFASAVLSLGLIIGPAARPAAGGFITVGVVDPASTNDIDQSGVFHGATGAAGPASVVDLATFRTSMTAAHPADLGGVIDFEVRNDINGNPIGSVDSVTELVARYGASAMQVSGYKSLTITSGSGTWNWPGVTTSGRVPTSGVNSLGKDGTDIFDFDILVGAITNGAADERVTQMGFTVLERVGTNLGSPLVVTGTFNDGSTVQARATINGVSPGSNEDAFFGIVAPAGLWITSVTFNPANFTTIDDLAFITTVLPEPAGLAAMGAAGLLLCRRRRSR